MAKGKSKPEAGQAILSTHGVAGNVLPTGTIPMNNAEADRLRRIAEAAYKKAERRGFAPGHDLEDWLEAEKEIDAQRTAGA